VLFNSGIPLAAARLALLCAIGARYYRKWFILCINPLSLFGLIFIIIVFFASLGRNVVNQIILILHVAPPPLVYFTVIFLFTVLVCRHFHFPYVLTSVQNFTTVSNNFDLAITQAISTFGPNSDQAMAATVGPLIEVPVLLGLVYLMRFWTRKWIWAALDQTLQVGLGEEDSDKRNQV